MYREEENKRRKGKFKNHNNEYNYFKNINDVLVQTQEYKSDLPEVYPSIFVFGLPRSGTTLLYQFISKFIEVGYFNNLMAKFWKAPLFAIELEKSLSINKINFNLNSNYGRSFQLSGPHEFSYFFQDLFDLNSIDRIVDFSEKNITFDRINVRKVLLNFQHEFNKPLVFKTNFIVNFMNTISQLLDKSFFIYIERDKIDVAISILNARKKFYGNYSTWWATYSDSYFDQNLNFKEQIFNQIHELEFIYKEKLNEIPEQKKMLITYKDLCYKPKVVYDELFKKLNHIGSVKKNNIDEIPNKLKFSTISNLNSLEEKNLYKYFKNKSN